MAKICKLIIQVHLAFHLIIDVILAFCYKKQMISCGHHVTFKPSTSNIKGIENMSFGNYVRFINMPQCSPLMPSLLLETK